MRKDSKAPDMYQAGHLRNDVYIYIYRIYFLVINKKKRTSEERRQEERRQKERRQKERRQKERRQKERRQKERSDGWRSGVTLRRDEKRGLSLFFFYWLLYIYIDLLQMMDHHLINTIYRLDLTMDHHFEFHATSNYHFIILFVLVQVTVTVTVTETCDFKMATNFRFHEPPPCSF
jgi:hypothetical protein